MENLDANVVQEALSWKTALDVWGIVSKMFKDACASKIRALRARTDNPAAGELRALRLEEDIDTQRGTVHVHRGIDREGDEKSTKTGLTRRFTAEPETLPLLRAMDAKAGGRGPLIELPDDRHLSRALKSMLDKAGIMRPELFVCDATRKGLTWYDLRATGITWAAIRGDDPLKIMQRAGHQGFATTQIYIREAEAVRDGFGEVFPPLPSSLLVPDGGKGNVPPAGGGADEECPESGDESPGNRLSDIQVRETIVEAPGIDPCGGPNAAR